MSVKNNKQVVLDFFEADNAQDLNALFGSMAENLTYWVQGNLPISGTRTKAEMVALLSQTAAMIESDFRITPTVVAVDGDRVVVEAVSHAKLKNGKVLDNTYCFVFTVRDGKIEAIKEYFDTLHMHELLGGFQP